MFSRLRRSFSYANVLATLALFIALGGSSYAALSLPKASVGPKQLKKNSVTSPKVKRGSLLLSDFRASQRAKLRGPQGLEGLQGPQGLKGDAGPSGATKVVSREGAFTSINPDQFGAAAVECDPGEVATGGGIDLDNGSGLDMRPIRSRPTVDTAGHPIGWQVRALNADSDGDNADTISLRAYVVCASP